MIRFFFSFLVAFIYCTDNTFIAIKKKKGEEIVGCCQCHLKETDSPWQMCKYCLQFILYPFNVDLSKHTTHSVIAPQGTVIQSPA